LISPHEKREWGRITHIGTARIIQLTEVERSIFDDDSIRYILTGWRFEGRGPRWSWQELYEVALCYRVRLLRKKMAEIHGKKLTPAMIYRINKDMGVLGFDSKWWYKDMQKWVSLQ
jgi:hypothetical protein